MQEPLSSDAVLAGRAIVPERVLAQEAQGELVLLNTESGQYFGLNAVGARVWSAVTSAPSVGEAVERLAGMFDVERERLARDVVALVVSLVQLGLLDVAA